MEFSRILDSYPSLRNAPREKIRIIAPNKFFPAPAKNHPTIRGFTCHAEFAPVSSPTRGPQWTQSLPVPCVPRKLLSTAILCFTWQFRATHFGSMSMLTLTSLSTRQQVSRRDGRLVIGRDFPLCLVTHSTPLIFARYDDRWIAHPLDATTVCCNGKTIRSAQVVVNGDLWEASGEKFQTQLVWEPTDQPTNPNSPRQKSSCKIRVSHSENNSKIYRLPKPEIVIGRSEFCDVQIDDPRCEPRQLLICCVAGFWYLHDLSRGGGDDGFQGFLPIHDGEAVKIGRHKLEFLIHQQVLVPAEPHTPDHPPKQDGSPPPPAAAPGPAIVDAETVSCESYDTGKLPGISPPKVDAAASAAVDPAPSEHAQSLEKDPHIPATTAQHPAIDEPDFPAAVPDEQCRAAAQAAFNLLASFSQMRPQRPRFFIDRWRNLAGVWTGIRTVEDACLEMRWSQAFEELQPLIRRAPFDKTLLLTFARMCEYSQFPDLCLQVLQILNQQYPNDHVVLRGLARITQCLGGQDPAQAKKAERYWRKVQQLCPAESREIENTIRTIQVSHIKSNQRK